MKRCECGASCSDGAVRCSLCGRILPASAPTFESASITDAPSHAVAGEPTGLAVGARPTTPVCGQCGITLAPDANFCPRCGAPRISTSGHPPLSSGPFGWMSAPRAAPLAGNKPKSPMLAAVLEILIAGVGLMYAGAVRVGIVVLVLTILVFGLLEQATNSQHDTLYFMLAVVWAAVRITLAVYAARIHNDKMSQRLP